MKTSIFNPGVVGPKIGKFYKQPNDKFNYNVLTISAINLTINLPELLEQFALLFPT